MAIRAFFRNRTLIILLLSAIVVKLFSLNENWVELYYAQGFYPVYSRWLRYLFGWIPFSVGDLLYCLAFIWLVKKVWQLVNFLKRHPNSKSPLSTVLTKFTKLVLVVYLIFSLAWGLNYDRQGIQKQLSIEVKPYSNADLEALYAVLLPRLNSYAAATNQAWRNDYNRAAPLKAAGAQSYRKAALLYPFLNYKSTSLKASMFTSVGHLFGFTGYYNPFSGEAQLKTNIPVFLKPFVLTHEMAHQLGYAKENEASFVAYLTSRHSTDSAFMYSVYFELYREVWFALKKGKNQDSLQAERALLHPQVRADLEELRLYTLKNRNALEPLVSMGYSRFLKLNNQPAGKATYSQVLAYLIAYAKRYGWNQL